MDAVARVISIIAILVSIGSLILSIIAFRRDNPKLRVSLEYWPQVQKEQACFNVRVINCGRRVARVERIYIYFDRAEPLWDSIAGGKPVEEAEPIDHQIPIYGVDGIPHHVPTNVKYVEVHDTLGKCYRFPRFSLCDFLEFRKLKVKIRDQWEKV